MKGLKAFVALAITCVVVVCIEAIVCILPIGALMTNSRFFVTANHISESTFPNAKKIYSDEKEDVAIYENLNYKVPKFDKDKQLLADGVSLYVDHYVGNCLYATCEDISEMCAGMSGQEVSYEDEKIGYISSIEDGKFLKIILY